jgi:hypothetical protein
LHLAGSIGRLKSFAKVFAALLGLAVRQFSNNLIFGGKYGWLQFP